MPQYAAPIFEKKAVDDAEADVVMVAPSPPPPAPVMPHQFLDGQCELCMSGLASAHVHCSGVHHIVRSNAEQGLGHSLCRVDVPGVVRPSWVCARCGSQGRSKFMGLLKRCREVPVQEAVLRRVLDGRSPVAAEASTKCTYISFPVAHD